MALWPDKMLDQDLTKASVSKQRYQIDEGKNYSLNRISIFMLKGFIYSKQCSASVAVAHILSIPEEFDPYQGISKYVSVS